MTQELFAKPCAAAIIERTLNSKPCILVQTRRKADGGETNGKIEIPAGKIREYEDVFTALRREVREETGLTVTEITGEAAAVASTVSGHATTSCMPFCITWNHSGAYSIILHTFICQAEGTPLDRTDETEDIRWMPTDELRRRLNDSPEQFFFMHVNALRKYLMTSPSL